MEDRDKPKNAFGILANVEDSILMLILVGMVVLAFLQIVLRNVFGMGLIWVEPLVFYREFNDPLLGNIMPGFPHWASLMILPIAFGIMTLRFVRFSFLSFLQTVKGKAT